MNNKLMTFKDKEVEVLELDGKILFNARNVGEVLELVNIRE